MTSEQHDAEYGRSVPPCDGQFLSALQDLGGAAGTNEIAEAVGAPYRSTHDCLNRLFETGDVNRRSIGESFLWLLADTSSDEDTGDY